MWNFKYIENTKNIFFQHSHVDVFTIFYAKCSLTAKTHNNIRSNIVVKQNFIFEINIRCEQYEEI